MNNRFNLFHRGLMLLIASLLVDSALAVNQRLKVEGVWSNDKLTVYRISQRDPNKNPRRIRVTGRVLSIDHEQRRLRVGPVMLHWRDTQAALVEDVRQGSTVEIDAQLVGSLGRDRVFVIQRLDSGSVDSPDSVELIGTVTGAQRQESMNRLDLTGIPTWTPTHLYSHGRARTRRLGDRRPADQLTIRFGDTELVVGGELELSSKYDGNSNLDRDVDEESFELQQELQLDLFMPVNDVVSGYVELKAEFGQEFDASGNLDDRDNRFRRGQSWIYLDHPFEWPIGLQLGRQNFAEQREWWWDDDLDAVRLFLDFERVGFDVGIARELAAEDLRTGGIDPEDKEILRLLSSARVRILSDADFALFFLHHDDRSSGFLPGTIIASRHEDEIDANLSWFGARLSGDIDFGGFGEIEYWLDSALLRGDETVYTFTDVDNSRSVVAAAETRSRSGSAVDIGASIVIDRRFEPTLTVGLAFDNGDFRQTGLEDNSDRFNGVTRFRYYGELTRPELSNIRITTLAFGLRFFGKSSLEIAHHSYRQQDARDEHSLRVDADTNGISAGLGTEIDLVAGFREWRHWDIEAVLSYFRPGAAFSSADPAWFMGVDLRYNY